MGFSRGFRRSPTEQKVYNPFDVLLFFKKGCKYKNYWFETATPTFFLKLLGNYQADITALENLKVNDLILGSFDVDHINLETLLWQTGYLTIVGKQKLFNESAYILGYPNFEVKKSVLRHLVHFIEPSSSMIGKNDTVLLEAMQLGSAEDFVQAVSGLFASIPNQWYTNNDIARYEGFYCSLLYAYLGALGLKVSGEVSKNKGRIDIVAECEQSVWLLELKVIKGQKTKKELQKLAKEAMLQMESKDYARQYLAQKRLVYKLAMIFEQNERNVVSFEFKEKN